MKFVFENKGMRPDSYTILLHSAERVLGLRKHVIADEDADYRITMVIDEALDHDRYIIATTSDHAVLRAANDCSAHAALGRFFREAEFDGRGSFSVKGGMIGHTPQKTVRGMYLATHFYNFYHSAPLHEVYEVIEDLALRGGNCVAVWFDMHHYGSMSEPGSQELVGRLRGIISYAKKIGMKASMTMIANESFADSPSELRAEWEAVGRYVKRPEDHYHLEICPAKEGGIDQILRYRREMLARFADLQIDYVVYWPYDQGGCTCMQCQPWGSNGFLNLLPYVREVVKEMIPNAKLIVSTWYFDHFVEGEWDEFYGRLTGEPELFEDVAYVMSFFHNGEIPDCIRRKGIPEGVEFVDFPEISMQYCSPWGGYGASVLTDFLDATNRACQGLYQGGFPYSEGVFEDANKFIELGAYTGEYPDAYEALCAYVAHEFCCGDELLYEAVRRTETALRRKKTCEEDYLRVDIEDISDIDFVYETLVRYNDILPEQITGSRKFRLYYLRAVIDYELKENGFIPSRSRRCQEAMREVNRIYHADERTKRWVCAPVGR